jgi:tetratricopeptide (TPR) repeat protein
VQQQKRVTPDRLVLLGAVLAALAYLPDVQYDFILDDVPLILLNPTITTWRNWKQVFVTDIFAGQGKSPFGIEAVHYRPVYQLWQIFNEQLFGSVLPWWHVTALLLHLGVTLLVYRLGIKLLKDRWTAALAALLFVFHPIHAESVAYVTASTDLLVALFALLSFLAYFKYREERGGLVYLVGSVLAAVMAMLSKESAVMIPWMVVAYEAVREFPPGAERGWKRYLWTVPYFAVVGAYVAVRTVLFGANTGTGPGGNRLAAFLDMPLVLMVYLRNLILPIRLSFFYPTQWSTEWTVLKGVAVALVIAAGGFLWKRYRGRSGVRLQLLWAGILFVPALLGVYAFVREDWVHDRHMYLVSVPFCLLAAVLLTDAKWTRKASAIASATVLAILLIDLAVQVPKFTDEITLYASAVKVAPRNWLLRDYYGLALAAHGHHQEASDEFKIATELAPQKPGIRKSYGERLAYLGQDDKAMAEFKKALELSAHAAPFQAIILSRMADLELKRREVPEAVAHLRMAAQLAPDDPNYHAALALALSQEGLTEEAEEQSRLEAGARKQLGQVQRASNN